MPAAHVQSIGASGGSVASRSATFGSSTTAGNLVGVVAVTWSGNVAAHAVSDNKGNSYTQAGTLTLGSNIRLSIFYAMNIAGGAGHIVTVTPDQSAFVTMSIHEYSGLDASNPFVFFNSGTGTDAAPTSGNVAAEAGVILGGMTHSNGAVRTITPGSGRTERYEEESVTFQPMASEDRVVTAGSSAATWTLDFTVTGWAAAVAAFREAGGVSAPKVPWHLFFTCS